jgi:hypothetical protein
MICYLYGPCRRFIKDNEGRLQSDELEAPACQQTGYRIGSSSGESAVLGDGRRNDKKTSQ